MREMKVVYFAGVLWESIRATKMNVSERSVGVPDTRKEVTF